QTSFAQQRKMAQLRKDAKLKNQSRSAPYETERWERIGRCISQQPRMISLSRCFTCDIVFRECQRP
ncbi:hypothetical protein PENTCL1PPCAC_21040, partial [Pristionchus entomophagus]